LAVEINRAARFSHPLSVMMFDLDNFKRVNDTQGHITGDAVLRAIWKTATATVRDVDTVARYGGDEFMVVLPETEIADARFIAERLQQSSAEHLAAEFGGGSIESAVTLSIGLVAISPTEPLPIETLIAAVDARLYEAKRMGKNRITS
jgi:diguanylate cyclase (GGDEF)-like protein